MQKRWLPPAASWTLFATRGMVASNYRPLHYLRYFLPALGANILAGDVFQSCVILPLTFVFPGKAAGAVWVSTPDV
ncbi:MAG: hypothetical protein WA628_26725 [Terriglobales bacterium]